MIKTMFIEPDQFYLVDEFTDSENISRLNPAFSRVVAAVDTESGKVVGIMVVQMVLHAEPIWIKEEYQGRGIWREMAETMDGYLMEMAAQGIVAGVYTQPTRPETKAICEKMGYYEAEHPLYVKLYGSFSGAPQPKGG